MLKELMMGDDIKVIKNVVRGNLAHSYGTKQISNSTFETLDILIDTVDILNRSKQKAFLKRYQRMLVGFIGRTGKQFYRLNVRLTCDCD